LLKNSSQVPLYHQLKQVITEDIRKGKYKSGEQLPTEIKLCEKYNVSRITVRKAISDLVEEKVLCKRQGKGTFVRETKMRRELISLGSFSDIATQSGKDPSSQILSNKIKKSSKDLAKLFKINLNDDVLELKRLLSINGEPFIIETSYYPIIRFPNLENYIDGNVSVYNILQDHYNTDIYKADKTLDITLSNTEQSSLFNCDPNSVMYLLKKTAYSMDNDIVHISHSMILGSKVTFTFTVNK